MGLHDAGPSLSAQLESFLDQSWRRWDLHVGDDGGTARDLAKLETFRERAGHLGHMVCVSPGPRRGFAANYMTMLRHLPPETGFVALSDQDDIWLPSKLERAVRALERVTGPGLYCGARVIWNPDSDLRRTSRALARAPSFRNALVENIACGNTIVLNTAALDLIRRSPPEADAVPFHDWWIYLLISGATVRRSVLSTQVRVSSYARVEDCVVLPRVHVGRHARLRKVVVDRGCVVPEGLVVGEPDPNDGRKTLLFLTPACRQRLDAGRSLRRDWLVQAMEAQLSGEEIQDLAAAVELLKRVVDFDS